MKSELGLKDQREERRFE